MAFKFEGIVMYPSLFSQSVVGQFTSKHGRNFVVKCGGDSLV